MKFFLIVLCLSLVSVGTYASDNALTSKADSAEIDSTTYTVMSGIFTVGENEEVPKTGRIVVREEVSDVLIGIYKPHEKTGKYLFILPAGNTYDISFEVQGKKFKSENLIIPTSTSYKKIHRKINLGKF